MGHKASLILLVISLISCIISVTSIVITFRIKKICKIRKNIRLRRIHKRSKHIAVVMSIITLLLFAATPIVFCAENTMSGAINTVILMQDNKDKDCVCYARCTGNKEDDEKTAFELIFGKDEYEAFVRRAKLTEVQKEKFEGLETGKDKSEFLINHITDAMVRHYEVLVSHDKNFRKWDGLDRSVMSFSELRVDLINLLNDYKVNGGNPHCSGCSKCAESMLKSKCMGMSHFGEERDYENWWQKKYYNEDDSVSEYPGNASGKYAIKLNDGSYYWYHQTLEACNYNAVKDGVYIGTVRASQHNGTMAQRACGIYSVATALSNILCKEITPWVVIEKVMKCSIEEDKMGKYFESTYDKNGIGYSEGSVRMNMKKLAELINEAYGSNGVQAVVVPFEKDKLDEYFNNDTMYAYAITSYRNGKKRSKDTDENFVWYNGGGHFMVLRGGKNGGYKCFTSASTLYGRGHDNIARAMNTELDWNTVKKHEKHGECIVIYRSISYYNIGDNKIDGIDYNKEVYEILLNDKEIKSKAIALSVVYHEFVRDFEKNFVFGLMGNIACEGNFGYIEDIWPSDKKSSKKNKQIQAGKYKGKWAFPYWSEVGEEVLNLAGTIVNKESVDILIDKIPKSTQGIGVGIVQWSGDRRQALLQIYKKMCTEYTQEELAIAEIMMMKSEIRKGGKLETKCLGKSAGQCATIIEKNYEKPAEGSSEKRVRCAERLATLLANVKSNTQATGEDIVDYAKQFVGNKYVWGGESLTNGCDCSGFVMAVYKHFGYSLPHSSSALRSVGNIVVKSKNTWQESDLKPGDIICYDGHVAIYDGNGKIVEAQSSKAGITDNRKWNSQTVLTVRRIIK